MSSYIEIMKRKKLLIPSFMRDGPKCYTYLGLNLKIATKERHEKLMTGGRK